MAEHNELGRWGERKATEYLEAQGYTIWERNWHTGHRDIDIIAYKDNTLVIVEVKTRRNNVFMEPEMAVNRKKAHSIMIAANLYVKTKRINMDIRFDIIAICGTSDNNLHINHIEGALRPGLW